MGLGIGWAVLWCMHYYGVLKMGGQSASYGIDGS